MHRIDENTFIDNSLVTCAEYQLFIDEMRAQGKFFQPDHWTSCQFPAGQAHVPILGVRFSDTQAFCKWLSGREEGKWRFRLPTADEAAGYPIPKQDERLNGFWTLDRYEHHFVWIGPAPVDPRGIGFSHIFDIPLHLARKLIINLDLDRALDLDRVRDLDHDLIGALDRSFISTLDFALDRARTYGLDLARDIDLARDRALTRDLDLARDLDHALALARDLASARDLTLALDINRAIDHDLTRVRDRAFNFDHALDFTLDQALGRAIALNRAIDHAIDHTLDRARDRDRAIDRALNLDLDRALYHVHVLDHNIDLITLQERIAGRSPAFEGIRLVKERKPD